MSKLASWGLLGAGTIGGELLRQLSQPEVAERLGLQPRPLWVLRSSGIWQPDASGKLAITSSDDSAIHTDKLLPDVVFNALPSKEDDTSAGYIRYFLKKGRTVVTAEKTALAYNFEQFRELSDNFARLGYNAAVGGGIRPLSAGKIHFQDLGNISQIHLTPNGTVTFITSHVAQGDRPSDAVQQAITLGYAEPGADYAATVFKQELEGDVPKKLAIFMNTMGLGDVISPDDIKLELPLANIESALKEAEDRRFIVSIYGPAFAKSKSSIDKDILGKFELKHGEWHIVAGFRKLSANPLFAEFATLTGPGNCFLVGLGPNEEDGVNVFAKGPGAGPHVTVNTMLDDYLALRKNS